MLRAKFIPFLVLAIGVLAFPSRAVLAAPPHQEGFITGDVTALACKTDISTGITTFLVTVEEADRVTQSLRLGQLTAEELGLVTIDEDGNPDCNEEALAEALGTKVEIDPATVIPGNEAPRHPVGGALATFFSDIIDYDTIMAAHENGAGFGVIAQALWLTQKLGGDADIFSAILEAKESEDFSAFTLDDGTTPGNWGQFRNAIMDGDKGNLGIVMSGHDHGNGSGNGNGQGVGNGQGNGNRNGNGNKDEEKENKGNGNKDK